MKDKQLKKNKGGEGFFMIGVDEAGRGALAGPVMAAAVIFGSKSAKRKTKKTKKEILIKDLKIRDSKKLSFAKREEFYRILKNHPEIKWGIGSVSAKMIDKINIWEATKMAMKKAIKNLERKISKKLTFDKTILIIDGNQRIGADFLEIPVVKADEKILLCSCASIIAKVKRDALMRKYEKTFSQYGFAKHKGYPTQFHKKMIRKYGFSPIHRKSFKAR